MLKITTVSHSPAVTVFQLTGQLDSDSVEIFNRDLISCLPDSQLVVLDLSELRIMTSAGIGAVLNLKNMLAEQKREFAAVNMPEQIHKVLEIVRLLPSFNVFRDMRELDEYLIKIQKRILEDGSFDSCR